MAFDIELLCDGSALIIQGRANSFGSHSMSLRGAFTLFKGALALRADFARGSWRIDIESLLEFGACVCCL